MGSVVNTTVVNTIVVNSALVKMSGNLNDAAMAGNVEEVLIRLNMGEDVNQKCYPRYSTPLHDAVCCGRQEVVTILVERGANVNELDYKNMTPLKLAVRNCNTLLTLFFWNTLHSLVMETYTAHTFIAVTYVDPYNCFQENE